MYIYIICTHILSRDKFPYSSVRVKEDIEFELSRWHYPRYRVRGIQMLVYA